MDRISESPVKWKKLEDKDERESPARIKRLHPAAYLCKLVGLLLQTALPLQPATRFHLDCQLFASKNWPCRSDCRQQRRNEPLADSSADLVCQFWPDVDQRQQTLGWH